jgi:hypothetical protein
MESEQPYRGGEKSAAAHHAYGRIGIELLVEGEPIEENVLAKLHPSATRPSTFIDRPSYTGMPPTPWPASWGYY